MTTRQWLTAVEMRSNWTDEHYIEWAPDADGRDAYIELAVGETLRTKSGPPPNYRRLVDTAKICGDRIVDLRSGLCNGRAD